MRVYLSNVNLDSRSGPNTFASRLMKQLWMQNIEIFTDQDRPQHFDVELAFIETNSTHSKPMVQRLDGIWFRPEDVVFNRNHLIKKTYMKASQVIFQSNFDRQMIEKWFGARQDQTGHVIHNGIEIKRVQEFPDAIINLREQYEKIFVCSANWHPQKRLKDNLRLFQEVRNRFKSACLIIMGENPDVRISDPHIFYTGSISHAECLAVYAASDWMIHLAYLDHCPNSVVEALSQETPIICSSSGGTSEIVKSNGIIIYETTEYDFSAVDYDSPPHLVFRNVETLPTLKVDPDYLDIKITTDKYISVLQKAIQSS